MSSGYSRGVAETMKALALTDFDSAPALVDLPLPEPAAGQVRVRVKAAALNGMDAAIASGMVKGMAEYQFPVVVGRDGAGVVEAVADGVDHVSVGDDVHGHIFFGPTLGDGTIAEYAVLPADGVVAKPATLDFTAAAALPLAGAAALAVVDTADVQQGQRVLIAGASGGVGSFAVQLAAARGATVIATGLPEDVERLQGLGAAKVVDYREDVAEQVLADGGEVDALLDLVSFDPDSFSKLAKAVRRRGKVGSTAGGATEEALEGTGLTGQVIMAMPNREALTTLISEIERGALRIDVEETLPLDEAAKALETYTNGHTKGKIVVTVED
jgi:NADPH:quinone reductase-like Zn-dependent oxidoreductase